MTENPEFITYKRVSTGYVLTYGDHVLGCFFLTGEEVIGDTLDDSFVLATLTELQTKETLYAIFIDDEYLEALYGSSYDSFLEIRSHGN